MQRCADSNPDKALQLICEMNEATRLGSAEACRETSDPFVCIGAVAVAEEDPSIIVEHIEDPTSRDSQLAAYVAVTGDASVLDLIEDNERNDGARVYNTVRLGALSDRVLTPDYCNLRGGYTGEYAKDNEEVNRSLCLQFMALSNWILARVDAAETDAEIARARDDIMAVVEAVTEGEIDLSEAVACEKTKQGVEWVSASMAFDGRPAGGGPWACTAGAKICWMCPEGFTWGLGKPHADIAAGRPVQCGRQVLVSDCEGEIDPSKAVVCDKVKQGVEWKSASMAPDGNPKDGRPWACAAGGKPCWLCPKGTTWGLGKPSADIVAGRPVQCGRQVLVSDCP
jgi:hypothetical protein